MEILHALQIFWLIQQITINMEQFWATLPTEQLWALLPMDQIRASLPQELGAMLEANQAVPWIAIGVVVLIGMALLRTVFD